MQVSIKEVKTRRELRKFASYPNVLYKDCPYYVPQIISMEMNTLDRKKNHAFEVCESKYFLAYDSRGRIVGRSAAIINHRYNKKVNERLCRMSWIDFIEDYDVFKALMDAVAEYAREKGMDTLAGPLGFLEFDVAGIVVDGFDRLPTAYGKYNYPYYDEFFTRYGFRKDSDYVEFIIKVPDGETIERYKRASKIVSERYGIRQAELPNKKAIAPYLDGVFSCMNRAYSKLHGYSEMSPGQIEDLKKQFLPNINVDYISILLNSDDKVIGFGVGMPSLAKAMQKAKGHMFPFGWIHLLRALKHNDTFDALLIAVDDDYLNSGATSMIFEKIYSGLIRHGIKYVESTRELEDNLKMQNLWNKMDYELVKRARTYTKEL